MTPVILILAVLGCDLVQELPKKEDLVPDLNLTEARDLLSGDIPAFPKKKRAIRAADFRHPMHEDCEQGRIVGQNEVLRESDGELTCVCDSWDEGKDGSGRCLRFNGPVAGLGLGAAQGGVPKEGMWVDYYEDGTPKEAQEYRYIESAQTSYPTGQLQSWHSNGQLRREGAKEIRRNGSGPRDWEVVNIGSWAFWSEKGTPIERREYTTEVRGYQMTLYDEEGLKRYEVPMQWGKCHLATLNSHKQWVHESCMRAVGLSRWFHPNGRVRGLGISERGWAEGTLRWWNDRGGVVEVASWGVVTQDLHTAPCPADFPHIPHGCFSHRVRLADGSVDGTLAATCEERVPTQTDNRGVYCSEDSECTSPQRCDPARNICVELWPDGYPKDRPVPWCVVYPRLAGYQVNTGPAPKEMYFQHSETDYEAYAPFDLSYFEKHRGQGLWETHMGEEYIGAVSKSAAIKADGSIAKVMCHWRNKLLWSEPGEAGLHKNCFGLQLSDERSMSVEAFEAVLQARLE